MLKFHYVSRSEVSAISPLLMSIFHDINGMPPEYAAQLSLDKGGGSRLGTGIAVCRIRFSRLILVSPQEVFEKNFAKQGFSKMPSHPSSGDLSWTGVGASGSPKGRSLFQLEVL